MSIWYRIDDPENPPPKDGTHILAWEKNGPFPIVAHWLKPNPAIPFDGAWIASEQLISDAGDDLDLTHWANLPDPPKDDAK